MSDGQTNEHVPNVVPENTPEPVEIPEIEQQAIERGWRPKEEFNGDPDKWVDAGEFMRRAPIFEKIDSMGRELRETKKALIEMRKHHEKVRETEYKRALEELKAQKRAAFEEGDTDKVLDIDDRISDIKAEQQAFQAQQQQAVNQPDPRFMAWLDNNSWYAQDNVLRAEADKIGLLYANDNPGSSPEDVLRYVSKEIRAKYLTPRNKARVNPVEGNNGSAARPAKSGKDDLELSDEEKRVMNTIVRSGVMTKEEYIADLKKIKGA